SKSAEISRKLTSKKNSLAKSQLTQIECVKWS
ncbi:MAG: hypothetical protein ACI9J3_002564, partial [Parvicellaceae bacterium]